MWGTGQNRTRAIANAAERINRRPPRTRRRRGKKTEKPAGPHLVRGRGYARRRPDLGLARAAVYLLLAAAILTMLVKYGLIPFMTP